MPYGGNPSGSNSDAVRLLVGDVSTSTAGELLANNDYAFFVAQTPNLYAAAALACNSLSALYTAEGTDKRVGDLSLSREQDSDYWRTLAHRYDRMSALQASPSAGGLSKSGKKAIETDTDLVAPFFKRNQFDNPGGTATTILST